MMDLVKRAKEYIDVERDPFFKREVAQLLKENNRRELRERFETELVFGTGGLRGIIGGGFSRMNSYTVGRATQGIAEYLATLPLRKGSARRHVVISYDSRNYSEDFASVCAEVCAAHDIGVFLFRAPHPTPLLSFAVRKLRAAAGIMITASHNPPEYNGYKAYWNDGAQIVAPHDEAIIKKIQSVRDVKRLKIKEAVAQELVVYIDEDIDRQYCKYINTLVLDRDVVRDHVKDIAVTYTPLHGVGGDLFQKLCAQYGYRYRMVEEQSEPNGDFPTVTSPNPEDPAALSMALTQARADSSDVVIAHDPDADRVAIAVRHDDKFHLLSGNQVGALLIDYVLQQRRNFGTLPDNGAVIKTIVTTELQRKISEGYGVQCYDTLTGFKHIAAKIREFEEMRGGAKFIIGGEESIGYMYGSEVRDKDGLSAAMLILEMTLYYKVREESTLIDRLHQLYMQHGYYEEIAISKTFAGLRSDTRMQSIMEQLRQKPPEIIGNMSIERIIDYQNQTVTNCATKLTHPLTGFPASDVLQFHLVDKSVISVRPSGTEPKIKFYVSCPFTPQVAVEQAQAILHEQVVEIESLINQWLKV